MRYLWRLPGERVDGHDFIGAAVAGGGQLCVGIPAARRGADGCAIVVVKNVVWALGALAHDYEAVLPGRTIAVTGSVGKTTTKEFIASVLEQKMKLHKSEGNHNNEIGLPMTILNAPSSAQAKVYEMGMSGLGEIDALSRMAEPDIAIITTIGSSHLEKLGSRENICHAKCEIAHGLKPNGILLCNGDEPLLFHEELEGHRPFLWRCAIAGLISGR